MHTRNIWEDGIKFGHYHNGGSPSLSHL